MNPTFSRFAWFSLSVVIALVVVLPVRAADCGEQDLLALDWLDKMSRSSHDSSYHGVITMHRGGRLQSVQVSHVNDGYSTSESMTRLTGQGAEVHRAGHPLYCVHPGHKLLRRGSEATDDDCGVAKYYRLAIVPGERIAGQRTVAIEARPRDPYRLGHRLSLDSNTGLLLRSDSFDVDGKYLERFQFTKLSYNEHMPGVADVEVRRSARHPAAEQSGQSASPMRPWSVTWVPVGFFPTDNPLPTSDRRTFTDGLAVFSVFLESSGIKPGEGAVREGGTLAYSRGMILAGEPVLVTVIGEVPLGTARMVADKVAWMQ